MSSDILSAFGPDTQQPQQPRAGSGGITSSRDVNRYQPPVGPKGINDPKGPGLHGVNSGNTNDPTAIDSPPTFPADGRINHGCCGSQGRY